MNQSISNFIRFHPDYPSTYYDYQLGKFYKNSTEVSEIVPDDTGMLSFYCKVKRKVVRKKALFLAYESLHGPIPEDHLVFQKDLDETNYKGSNLMCLHKDEVRDIKDALYNVQGGIKLVPHPNNAYAYVLIYKEKGRKQQISTQEITKALRLKRKIIHKCQKYLNSYFFSA